MDGLELFVVPFYKPIIQGTRNLMLVLVPVALVIVVAMILRPSLILHPAFLAIPLFLLCLLLVPYGLVSLVFCSAWLREDRAAFVIGREGLMVGFAYCKTVFLPWEQVRNVCLKEVPVKGQVQQFLSVELVHVRQSEFWRHFCCRFQMLVNELFGCPAISIGTMSLAKPVEEIEQAISECRSMGARARASSKQANVGSDLESISVIIEDRVSMGGQLNTLEDYRRIFRRHLTGWWDSSEGFTAAPMDISLGFMPDGSGSFSGLFTAPSGEFVWREFEDGVIEVALSTEATQWHKISWTFSEVPSISQDGHSKVRLKLMHELADEEMADEEMADEEMEDEEDEDGWLFDMTFEPLYFSWPCDPAKKP